MSAPELTTAPGAVELAALGKRYGDAAAVDDVTLSFASGSFVAILGPSGCGKSTLLGMIGGFVPPDTGDIRIGGRSVVAMPPERRPTAMVFQTLALFPHLSTAGNIAFGMRGRGLSRAQVRARTAELLELVQLPEFGKRRISQLSGGQRQRVAIARALAVEPAVLLLDEPLSALDAQMRRSMQLELRAIQQRTGTTFVYVTHDQHEAMSMADRIVIMRSGRVEQHGSPQEIYTRPETPFVAGFLGDANVVSGDSDLAAVLRRLVPADCWAVRPEHVQLVDPGDPRAQVSGTVARATFYGQTVRYEVTAGLPDPLVVVRPGDEPVRADGERVGLVLDAERITGLPGAS
ncbi:ABC transporter ATP-binding protein [Amycolatopsis jejuensis]|uniref:ABC transporter ATP-binding protein n=1 Tax=Amycolatopsis jejuensis TaxID=330084 RepID=UPI000690674A|nr:ABC transporter ATP-binding protein [Amycolatopsis jejuensis]